MKLIYKKKNQSVIDVENDLNGHEQQESNEKKKTPESLSTNDKTPNNNNNNYSFDQNKNQNSNQPGQTNEHYYGGLMKNMNKDNLDYINSLMQKNKQNEIRINSKKAHHSRTKSSIGQYQTGNQQIQQNELNTSSNNRQISYNNAQDPINDKMNQNEFKDQLNTFENLNKNHTYRNTNSNQNNQESKENNITQQQQPQIQQKSLSHRSLNETLPIFSKQNKNQQEKNNETQKKNNHISNEQDQKGQHNNLSFKIESERKKNQQQIDIQQKNINQLNNSDNTSANETNYSTRISSQKAQKTQFLQFLGNYVNYLSQPDEVPSQTSPKPNSYQNNFFNSHNSINSQSQRYQQPIQKNNLQIQNQVLIQENSNLLEQLQFTQQVVRDLNAEKNLTLLEFSKLQKEKSDYKKKTDQLEFIVQQLQSKYQEVVNKYKETQDNLAKITVDHENQKFTFKYALQQFQAQQLKNNEFNQFKSNSKNSYSSSNFNFTQKRRESNCDMKFEDYINNSNFFSIGSNQKYPMVPKQQHHLKSPINSQKMPININPQNFQHEKIYEGEPILNNTGIFNYTNEQMMGEVEDINQHKVNLKPQIMNQNMIDFNQMSSNEQEIECETDENIYNNYNESGQQFEYSDLQHSQNVQKQPYFNYHNQNQIQSRNKKHHSLHMGNPTKDEKNINESYYNNFLQNKMINDGNFKNPKFLQQEQMFHISKNVKKDLSYQPKNINVLKNSGINSSQTSKRNFNNSNIMTPSVDYFQDISQNELQNNSLQLNQLE